jgi:hypothetical protein
LLAARLALPLLAAPLLPAGLCHHEQVLHIARRPTHVVHQICTGKQQGVLALHVQAGWAGVTLAELVELALQAVQQRGSLGRRHGGGLLGGVAGTLAAGRGRRGGRLARLGGGLGAALHRLL